MSMKARLLATALLLSLSVVPAVAQSSNTAFDVGVSVSPERVPPGGIVTIDVVMSTRLDMAREYLYLYLPKGMQFVGQPTCSGACTQASVHPQDSNQVNALYDLAGFNPMDNAFAYLTVSASVSFDVQPGETQVITAYFGSPAVTDRAEVFVESLPELPPATLGLNVSPDSVVVGTDGVFSVSATPFIFTSHGSQQAFADSLPLIASVSYPASLRLASTSICVFLSDPKSEKDPRCHFSSYTTDSGLTVATLEIPPRDREIIGLIFTFQNEGVNAAVPTSILLTIGEPSGLLEVTANQAVLPVYALDSLPDLGNLHLDSTVTVLLTSSELSCSSVLPEGAPVGIAGWDGSILATSQVLAAPNGLASADVGFGCPRIVSFQDVPQMPLYSIGLYPDSRLGFFCRYCVIGAVPWAENSIPVLVEGDQT